jgi:hypothetical protein
MQLSDPSGYVARKRGPQHAYVKIISRLNFAGNVSSADGSTMLSAIMTDGRVFQFRIVPGGSGGYSMLDIGDNKSKSFPSTLPSRKSLPISSQPSPSVGAPIPPPVSSLLRQQNISALPLRTETPSQIPQIQNEDRLTIVSEGKGKKRKNKKVKKHKRKQHEDVVSIDYPMESTFDKAIPRIDLPSSAQSVLYPEKSEQSIKEEKTTVSKKEAGKAGNTYAVSPSTKTASLGSKKLDASSLLKGLNTAKNLKKVGYRSLLWDKTQDAIYVLRLGKSLENASKRSGVKLSTLESLMTCTPKSCEIR